MGAKRRASPMPPAKQFIHIDREGDVLRIHAVVHIGSVNEVLGQAMAQMTPSVVVRKPSRKRGM